MKLTCLISIVFMCSFLANLAESAITFYLPKQYYECKNLVMAFYNYSYSDYSYYYPNSSIPNNRLNDSFFEARNFANMTLDQGLGLIRTIFQEVRTCRPIDTCNCIKSGFKKLDFNKAVLFLNETLFAQTKQIVSTFINKFKPYLNVMKEYSTWDTFYSYNLPSLARFASNNDFTTERYYSYNATLRSCLYEKYIRVIFFSDYF